MLPILKEFHQGTADLADLKMELASWDSLIERYEADDVYPGDQYYQDALGTRDALQEAVSTYYDYYDADGNFKNNA